MKFDENGWLDEAIEIACLENTSPRNGRAIKYIVQHGTAGGSSAESIGNFYRDTIGGENPVSTHFVIGKNGHIVQCVPLNLAAWANGFMSEGHAAFISESFNPNEDTASIEYVKNQVDANGVPDNSDELTDAQKLSGFRLTKCICEIYNIPKQAGDENGGIIAHRDIDPANRSRCPGTFPWDELWAFLASKEEQAMIIDVTNPIVARYFKASTDGKIWICKNGFIIGGAILDFYKTFGGKALCGLSYLGLPTSNEISIGNGRVIQRFERGVLCFDPSRGNDNPPGIDTSDQVYTAHIDKGVGQDPQVTTLQKQVEALQQNTLAQANASLQNKITQAVKTLQG